MVNDEIKQIVYLGISLVVASMVLVTISFGLSIRNDIANARFEEYYAMNRAELNRKYGAYNRAELSGSAVVTMIRNLYDSGIDLYINEDKYGKPYILDSLTRGLDYTNNANRGSVCSSYIDQADVIFALGLCNDYIFAQRAIACLFGGTDVYYAELIYDGHSVRDASSVGKYSPTSMVTGIRVIKQ